MSCSSAEPKTTTNEDSTQSGQRLYYIRVRFTERASVLLQPSIHADIRWTNSSCCPLKKRRNQRTPSGSSRTDKAGQHCQQTCWRRPRSRHHGRSHGTIIRYPHHWRTPSTLWESQTVITRTQVRYLKQPVSKLNRTVVFMSPIHQLL